MDNTLSNDPWIQALGAGQFVMFQQAVTTVTVICSLVLICIISAVHMH